MSDYIVLDEYMYPCANYVIKRLNLTMTPTELANIEPKKYSHNSELKPGDILVWKRNNSKDTTTATLILHGQTVISTNVLTGLHFAVIEEDGLISDLIAVENSYLFTIRIRQLCDAPVPTGYISKSDLVSE